MPADVLEEFYREYGKALDDRDAALFIGAGISQGAGLKGWPDLLSDAATDLGLHVDKEPDLVALAQYHVNERTVRSQLTQLLVEEYGQEVPLTENHRLIARLQVESVWTTNYDRLLERAYSEAGKRVDTKVTTENLATTSRGRDVTVYKMHGDISQPHDTVLTKDEYEVYGRDREAFVTALKGDLVNKTFLFLGFSFTDPNIDYILSRIRILLGQNPRQHYLVMKRPAKPGGKGLHRADHEYAMRKLELRIGDLKRYGIRAIMVDDYAEVTEILRRLNRTAHRKSVFISGSAADYGPLGQPRIENLSYLLGQELIRGGFNVVSGFELGIGSAVITGALDEVYRTGSATIGDRLLLRPFPQLPDTDPRRDAMFSQYRRDMISQAGASVFLCGNRTIPGGREIETSAGVLEEFAITQEFGKYPVPVGATGSAAREIWEAITASGSQYADAALKGHLETVGNPGCTDRAIVAGVLSILKHINKQ